MSTLDGGRTANSVELTVTQVIEETVDARSLVFAVPDHHRELLAYRPGQFLTLRVPSERTGFVARCYSLASSPHVEDAPKVTVKRTQGGYGSNWLCDNIVVGARVEVLPPAGTFTPANLDGDFLLWAAGSGITPMMSILKSVLHVGAGRVVLVYANRDEHSVIFADELRSLAALHADRLTTIHWLESDQGLPTTEALASMLAPFADHESFICGPAPFMQAVTAALQAAGVPRTRVHSEVFRSLSGDPFAPTSTPSAAGEPESAVGEATLDVTLDGQQHHVPWPRTQTLVEALIAAGIDVPYSCLEGQCGSCACTVVRGDIEMPECDILEPEDLAAGLVLGCRTRPAGDHVEIEF